MQAIPASTRVIRVEILRGASVLQADGQAVALEVFRPVEAATSTASLEVPAGGPYEVRVRAYKDDVLRTSEALVAEGSASEVTIATNKVVALALSLVPVGTPPAISRLSPSSGGPTSVFDVVGTGFGVAPDPLPLVLIGTATATIVASARSVEPGAESTLSVAVPDSAGAGEVVVNRDGLLNGSRPFFTVLQELRIVSPPTAMTVPATFSFRAEGVASPSGAIVQSPAVSWACGLEDPEASPAPEIDPDTGVASASVAGILEVAAMSGTLIASVSVTLN